MNLVLSPSLAAICNRSGKFRTNLKYDQLNVCNVIRSFLFVLTIKTALVAFIVGLLVHAFVQVIYVMVAYGTFNASTALDYIFDYAKLTRTGHIWIGLLFDFSAIASALLTAVFMVVLPVATVSLSVFIAVKILPQKFRQNTMQKLVKVLTPTGLFAEYIQSKHSKFCVNVSPIIKVSHAEELRDKMKMETDEYWYTVSDMSTQDLKLAIENSRNILTKHART